MRGSVSGAVPVPPRSLHPCLTPPPAEVDSTNMPAMLAADRKCKTLRQLHDPQQHLGGKSEAVFCCLHDRLC